MKPFRSLLFVPGSRPERFEKAIAAGPDAICIDLEDAVPPQDKASARAGVMAWLAGRAASACAVGVRINALSTLDGFRDVVALADAGVRPDYVMVPKAEHPSALEAMIAALDLRGAEAPPVAVWALVESVAGLCAASDLAAVCGGDGGILFGGVDFSAAIGTGLGWEALFHARSTLATACRVASGTLLDVPYLDVGNETGLREECERVKALGFNGKACIHPSQVATVNAVFAPSAAEIAWAHRVVDAGRNIKGGAMLLDGKLLDAPVYLRAQRILDQAGAAS
jgi:citrate lyase beta subunit